MAAEERSIQPLLGKRLRELRKQRGLALAETAEATGISRSFLSLVENGQNEITIGRLVRLMAFYEVHVGDFLDGLGERPHDIVRASERRVIPSPDERMRFLVLAPDEERTMLPMLVEVEPGGGLAEMGRHPGEEFIHILEGELELTLEDAEPVTLRAGDTAWYQGQRGHTFVNPTDTVTLVLSVISPPNL